MKKNILRILFLFLTLNIFSQNIETITKRVSNEICECVGETTTKSELKKKLKECSDEKINFIMNNSTKEENKVLVKGNNLQKVISLIEPSVLANCENVRQIIENDLENEVKKVNKNEKLKPFPTNFGKAELKKALKNPKKYDGKIISFDSEIVRVEKSKNNTPFYEAKIGNKTIWVVSMLNSGFERIGNKVRVLGYFMLVDKKNNDFERKYHQDKFQILSFATIDLKTVKLVHFPGSENQMKEWMNGKIPSGGK